MSCQAHDQSCRFKAEDSRQVRVLVKNSRMVSLLTREAAEEVVAILGERHCVPEADPALDWGLHGPHVGVCDPLPLLMTHGAQIEIVSSRTPFQHPTFSTKVRALYNGVAYISQLCWDQQP